MRTHAGVAVALTLLSTAAIAQDSQLEAVKRARDHVDQARKAVIMSSDECALELAGGIGHQAEKLDKFLAGKQPVPSLEDVVTNLKAAQTIAAKDNCGIRFSAEVADALTELDNAIHLAVKKGSTTPAAQAVAPGSAVELFTEAGSTFVRAGSSSGLNVGDKLQLLSNPIGRNGDRRVVGSASLLEVWNDKSRVEIDAAGKKAKAKVARMPSK